MNERINVLAAMVEAIFILHGRHPQHNSPAGNELDEARAAVAELIEAAKESRSFLASSLRLHKCDEDFISDQTRRLDVALARVSGGAL